MSRYYLSKRPLEVIVGWDNPLRTYFLQIIDPKKNEEEEVILWLGLPSSKLPTIADLERAIEANSKIIPISLPPELREKLEAERINSPRPTELQREIGKLLGLTNSE